MPKKHEDKVQSKTPTKQYVCKGRGCNDTFKHRTQLTWHKLKCNLPSPQKSKKEWNKLGNNKFQCEKCGKVFPYQMSIFRHVKTCDPTKEKEEIQCTFCDKIFTYPSYFKRHLSIHTKAGDMMVPSFTHNDTMLSDTTIGLLFEPSSDISFEPTSDTSLLKRTVQSSLDFSVIEPTTLTSVIISDSEHSPESLPDDTINEQPKIADILGEVLTDRQKSDDDIATNPVNSVGEFHNDLPLNNTVIEGSRKWKKILTHTDATGVKEADVCQCLIHYLKSLLDSGKGRHQFNY